MRFMAFFVVENLLRLGEQMQRLRGVTHEDWKDFSDDFAFDQ